MAKRKNAVRVTSPFGRVVWANLSKPSTKFDKNGVYELSLVFDDDKDPQVVDFVKKINEAAEAAKADFVKQDPKTAKFKLCPEIGPDEDKEGNVIPNTIRIKTKLKASGVRDDGTTWTDSVTVVDAANKEIPKTIMVGRGSIARAQIDLVPFAMAATRTAGVSLKLRAVQVKSLSEYKQTGDFDAVDGYVAPDATDDSDTPFVATGDAKDGDY